MDISKYANCKSYPELTEVHEMLLRAQGTASLSLPEWRQKFDDALAVAEAELSAMNAGPERPEGVVISAPSPAELAAEIAAEGADEDAEEPVEVPEPDPRFTPAAALGSDAVREVPEPADLDDEADDEVEVPADPEPAEEPETEPETEPEAEPEAVPNVRNIRRVAEYREPVLSQQEIDEVEDKIEKELPASDATDDVDGKWDGESSDDEKDSDDDDSES